MCFQCNPILKQEEGCARYMTPLDVLYCKENLVFPRLRNLITEFYKYTVSYNIFDNSSPPRPKLFYNLLCTDGDQNLGSFGLAKICHASSHT